MIRSAIALFALCLAACGGAVQPLDAAGDDLIVAATIGPQSLTHGTLTASARQLAYSFSGAAGDVIAPDAWPTGTSALLPTLVLLGPKGAGGHRSAVAAGAARGGDPKHVAIDGFRLPRAGNYLVVVGGASGAATGKFSLRLWMQSSHFPRQETAQVDLSLTPSAAVQAAAGAHQKSPHAWTDGEVDGVISDMLAQADARTAFSSAQVLIAALASPDATDAQRARAAAGAVRLVGTPQQFGALDPKLQAFALAWLGSGDGRIFLPAQGPLATPDAVDREIARLVAAWPGAQEDASQRHAEARVLNGVVYGWQVDWIASVLDTGGTAAWIDFSREWFDGCGKRLGEQSQGAAEPDDD